jgi:Fe-Mn family superoxide dismutase
MTKHVLPTLGYGYDALEPHFDARTMEIHHTKHHQAYVNNLNAALEKHPGLFDVKLDKLLRNLPSVPDDIRVAVQNNGGGHWNHSFFWHHLSASGGGRPTGRLAATIDRTWGSFEELKKTFSTAAATRFGSGWAWLSLDRFGNPKVHSTANQDSPIVDGYTPIVGLDVWEHAYYLQDQNRRPDYVEAFWNVLDWQRAAETYEAAYSCLKVGD